MGTPLDNLAEVPEKETTCEYLPQNTTISKVYCVDLVITRASLCGKESYHFNIYGINTDLADLVDLECVE